jgi:hypothetical protein
LGTFISLTWSPALVQSRTTAIAPAGHQVFMQVQGNMRDNGRKLYSDKYERWCRNPGGCVNFLILHCEAAAPAGFQSVAAVHESIQLTTTYLPPSLSTAWRVETVPAMQRVYNVVSSLRW